MTLMNITFKIESGVYSRCDVQNLYCFFIVLLRLRFRFPGIPVLASLLYSRSLHVFGELKNYGMIQLFAEWARAVVRPWILLERNDRRLQRLGKRGCPFVGESARIAKNSIRCI